jgi:diketogulonate reductase-like aldo/keto reductase
MGESGVHLAMKALDRLVMPTYAEGIQLITCVATPTRGARLASQYRALEKDVHMTEELPNNVRLSDSLNIPAISLGTMGIKKRIAKDVVRSIISAGITSIDTAPTYKNENMIGDALSTANDIFCIGKIPKSAVQPEHVRPELESTLEKLQRKHVDLLLLHWPCDVTLAGTMADVWKEMEKCLNDGLCKALGVCNFNANSLAMLLTNCSVRPVVNQVERHPLLAQWDLIDFCERNGVIVQAHSPLGQGKDELLANSVIEKVAADTSMSPAQVVIRWNLQHGVLVTPRCTSKAHAVELLSCKALLADHMKLLDSLDRGRRFVAPPFMYGNQDYCWGSALPR